MSGGKRIVATGLFDWASIDATPLIGWTFQMRQLLQQGRLDRALSIDEPSREVLTQEFFSTLVVDLQADRDDTSAISFRMAGEPRHFSFDQFAVACGFYDETDTVEAWFQQLLIYGGDDTLTTANASFWPRVRRDAIPFAAGRLKATLFRNPLHRFLQGGLARTITARHESLGHILARDLFLIRTMVDGTPTHLGYLVAHHLQLMCAPSSSALLGGAYITRVARYLGLLDWFRDVPTYPSMMMDSALLVRMKLLRAVRGLGGRAYEVTADAHIPGHDVDEEAELDAMDAPVSPPHPDEDFSLPDAVRRLTDQQAQFQAETRAAMADLTSRVYWLQRRDYERHGGSPPPGLPPFE